jgi:ABC-type branched-subunit amino acid transport system substrate-binding protein
MSFTTLDGLPDNHAFCVRRDGDRVWVGTARGLALYEGGRWRRFGTADGLPHRVVLSLDVNSRTGDLWVGTMAGLARLSAGRFDLFHQLNSGLPNDVVNGVRYNPEEEAVWAATAMGAGRLDLRTGAWTIYTHENTPMHEPWTYSVAAGDGHVFVGAWGAGVLDRNLATGEWREYRDPDKEFEIDLFADDGPVSDVTSSVDYAAGILWQASYVGLTRYDGREWRSYYAEDSGLAGNFVNFVRAAGPLAYLATDQGVSVTDGDDWMTFRRRSDGRGEVRRMTRDGRTSVRVLPAGPGDNFVLGVDAGEGEIWLATGKGVSRGVRGPAGESGAWADAPRFANPGAAAGLNRGSSRFHYADTPAELQPFRGRIPYKDLFSERPVYLGPGREEGAPAEPDSVAIGFIGPLEDKDNPVLPPGARAGVRYNPKAVYGRRMLQGASMAVQEANAAGGLHGRPFRIVPRTDLVLWGQTSNEMVRFAYEDGVWAVLSAIDSNHNHVLSRTTLKTEVPVVTGGSTDPTLVEHNIPWLVRAIQDDRQQAYALLHEIFRVRSLRRVALLRSSDRDGRTGVEEVVAGARRLGRPVVLEQRFDPGERDFSGQLARIREVAPEALILWGNAAETGAVVQQARASGLAIPVYGFDRMAGADFLQAAGAAAEGITAVSTLNPDRDDPAWRDFRERYQSRWGEDPDTFAAHGYDAMNLILSAVQRGGLNRVRIRDELFALRTVPGVSGPMVFDTNMSNVAPLWLAVVKNGRFHYSPAPRWGETANGSRPGSEAP